MAWTGALADLEYHDEEKLDRRAAEAAEPPDYPPGCCFCIAEADLEEAGAQGGEPGDVMRFAAMGTVTACHVSTKGCRIELELTEFAGEDGKFFALAPPAHISLCDPELEKMGLEADCEVNDMIHLIGEAKLESLSRSEFGETAMLQIVRLSFEDESEESR